MDSSSGLLTTTLAPLLSFFLKLVSIHSWVFFVLEEVGLYFHLTITIQFAATYYFGCFKKRKPVTKQED